MPGASRGARSPLEIFAVGTVDLGRDPQRLPHRAAMAIALSIPFSGEIRRGRPGNPCPSGENVSRSGGSPWWTRAEPAGLGERPVSGRPRSTPRACRCRRCTAAAGPGDPAGRAGWSAGGSPSGATAGSAGSRCGSARRRTRRPGRTPPPGAGRGGPGGRPPRQAQRPGRAGDQARRGPGIAAGEQRDVVPGADQLLRQVRDDALRPAVSGGGTLSYSGATCAMRMRRIRGPECLPAYHRLPAGALSDGRGVLAEGKRRPWQSSTTSSRMP